MRRGNSIIDWWYNVRRLLNTAHNSNIIIIIITRHESMNLEGEPWKENLDFATERKRCFQAALRNF